MKRSLTCIVIFLVVGLLSLRLAGAASTAPREFMTSITVTELKDGAWEIVAQPCVNVHDGKEGLVLQGGEVMDTETRRWIPHGIETRVKVREVGDGKLRLSMHVSVGELEAQGESSFVVHEWGVHCMRTLAPGEDVVMNLGAQRRVSVRVVPVRPRGQ